MSDVPKLAIDAIFLPAKPTSGDPMGQRGYLAIKVVGGLHVAVIDGNVQGAVAELRDETMRRVEAAIFAALQTPDTSARA